LLCLISLTISGCSQAKTFLTGEKILWNLDPILLTPEEMPGMVCEDLRRVWRGPGPDPPIIKGYIQSWGGEKIDRCVTIRYWLLYSSVDARKAGEKWRYYIAHASIKVDGKWVNPWRPVTDPELMVGDKTWKVDSGFMFVKNNVLILVSPGRPKLAQSSFTLDIARKIEAKIERSLMKK